MPTAKPGKYDAVLPKLKPLQPEDLSYQEKVNQVKATITTRDARELADKYIRALKAQDEIRKHLYDVTMTVTAYEQLLEDSQERGAAGWGDYGAKENALRLTTGGTIRVQPEPCGVVKDKDAFRKWCIANGYGDQLQLWPSRMNAICKERLVAGYPEPDGCETFRRTKIVYTRGDE